MKTIFEQCNEATKHISLSEDDKLRMREKLVEYMEYKPIRPLTSPLSEKRALHTALFPYFRAHHLSGALMIAVLATSSTFGVSFAAGDALPGDLLYPVKVKVNEEIKTVFTSDESRVAWEQERAGRRLVEASQLAAEGRLDAKKQETVSKLFAEHTEAMVEQVLATEETDPVLAAEMSSEFEDSLEAHEAVLARLIVEQDSEGEEGGRNLVEQVRTATMEVQKIRNNAEEKIAIDESEVTVLDASEEKDEVVTVDDQQNIDSANLRVRAAYRAQVRALKLLSEVQSLQASLDPNSQLAQQAQAQIAFGEELTLQGEQALKDNNLGEAYGKYRRAAASFQKVEELLKVASLFSIEIFPDKEIGEEESKETAEVDTKNDDEENTEIIAKLETLRTNLGDEIRVARTLLLTKEGYDSTEVQKANSEIKNASALLMRGEIAMVLKDYAGARKLFEQAHKLTSQTVRMLESASDAEEVHDVDVPVQTEVVEPEAKAIILTHQYADGTHVYTGTVGTSYVCQTLDKEVLVAESYPEQITLKLTRVNPEAGTMCAQALGEIPFSIEVTASEKAILSKVQLNGVEQKVELIPENTVPEQVKSEKKQNGFFESIF